LERERATALFEESLARDREVGEKKGTPTSLANLALAALDRGDHRRATGLLLESLTLQRKLENGPIMVECLEVMAGVAGARAQALRAARLWGAAQAFRVDMGAPLPSDELALLEPYLTTARSLVEEGALEVVRGLSLLLVSTVMALSLIAVAAGASGAQTTPGEWPCWRGGSPTAR
jgi:hypothetical protein